MAFFYVIKSALISIASGEKIPPAPSRSGTAYYIIETE